MGEFELHKRSVTFYIAIGVGWKCHENNEFVSRSTKEVVRQTMKRAVKGEICESIT